MKRADRFIEEYRKLGMTPELHFKATCPKCGERPQFVEPNTFYREMECCHCGHSFPFVKGGFSAMFTITGKKHLNDLQASESNDKVKQ